MQEHRRDAKDAELATGLSTGKKFSMPRRAGVSRRNALTLGETVPAPSGQPATPPRQWAVERIDLELQRRIRYKSSGRVQFKHFSFPNSGGKQAMQTFAFFCVGLCAAGNRAAVPSDPAPYVGYIVKDQVDIRSGPGRRYLRHRPVGPGRSRRGLSRGSGRLAGHSPSGGKF